MNIFKELRKQKGLTQVELAKILNVQQTTVSKWEVERATPDYTTLIALAGLYDVSIDYLLGRTSTEQPTITPEERAVGAAETKAVRVTPAEDELLYIFREIGKKHGEKGQQSVLNIAENLLNLSDKD